MYLKLNRRPFTVAGVNYHEHDPVHGKVLREERLLNDLVLLKRNNFNAIRASHYPHIERFYELCDEMGFFVIDEANIEAHGFALLTQRCHSCRAMRTGLEHFSTGCKTWHTEQRIIRLFCCWSLGNESGWGPNHAASLAWLLKVDPSRPVQYEEAKGMEILRSSLAQATVLTAASSVQCTTARSPLQKLLQM